MARSSATPLTLLYAGLIVYASLYPFSGWRWPGHGLLDFLVRPWPRWWTGFDLAANLLGYVPLGGLAFVALLRSAQPAARAWWLAAIGGTGLSLTTELLQNLLPMRVPSNVDLGLNAAGAALGASLGAWLHLMGGVARWQTLRDRWFTRHSAGGIALLVAWPAALLFPLPLPLAVGQLVVRTREALWELLEETPAADWAADWLPPPLPPGLSPAGEWLLVALGLLAPCLVAFAISLPGRRRLWLALLLGGCGVASTTLSTALNFGPEHAFAWATPKVLSALLAALLAAVALARMPRRAVSAVGLVVLTALVVLITQAPDDPYFAESLQAWEQGRFIRFHGAAQWLGWLWPYAAIAYLLALTGLRPERRRLPPSLESRR